MKYLIILGDGMSDEPILSLGNKTPLEAANTPNIDKLAEDGCSGLLKTIPDSYHPGSEIANLTVLGYKVSEVFEGRGSLEAAAMGIDLQPGDLAMRCNLITIENDKIKNHSAGHISDEEAEILVEFLNKEICPEGVTIYPGVSYRHLFVINGGYKSIRCTPPHDVPGNPFLPELPVAETADAASTETLLREMIIKSQKLLPSHPVNLHRKNNGKEIASSIWPWSPGYKPDMKTLPELYNIKSGAVITAVDLIRGIGVYAGLEVINVDGATGLYNTNYEGKAIAAIEALKKHDFVYLHIEASDEAGHEGDAELKTRTIEYLDYRIVKPIREAIKSFTEPVAIALLPDHPTPCNIKTHTRDDVPFIIYKPGNTPDLVKSYSEKNAREGSYGRLLETEFMSVFLNN